MYHMSKKKVLGGNETPRNNVVHVPHVHRNKTKAGSATAQKIVVKGLHNESKCFAVIMKQSSLVMDTHNM